MRVGDLLDRRRQGWQELDKLCERFASPAKRRNVTASEAARFAALYRAACTDLAMSEEFKLPPATVDYLHRLVGRAHSQLYRSGSFPVDRWWHYLMVIAPRAIFNDPCVKVAFIVFFGLFALSALMAWAEGTFPGFAESVMGKEQMETMEESFSKGLSGNFDHFIVASAGYIQHNTSIGLSCFALGPLLLPSLVTLAYNGIMLGASFGYMARPEVDAGDTFLEFVTAHGVFELTAIALSAAAGLRLGVGLWMTGDTNRLDSFLQSAKKALPIMMVAVVLFFLAALIEGFVSPSSLPYAIKAFIAIASASLLMFYFVILGYPSDSTSGTLEEQT
ncbi:MAG: stage II sporulation protein M [Planctomycetes bacterium]|nr:stage II sporulation protein M [Planctomycetota bacterium]